MRWPLVWRSTIEREAALSAAENSKLRRRLHILRDNMKQAAWRCGFNLRLPDNQAIERILTIALVRDLEEEQGTNA